MKAIIKPRIDLENRTRIEEVIPLSTPITMFIDPCNLCNFKCRFCPTGHSKLITERFNGTMKFDIYKKLINEFKDFENSINTVHMYKEGEPLLNKNFSEMVKYAKESGFVDHVDTTTNGYLLNEDLSKEILDNGLDRINISVNGMSNKQFLEFTGIRVNFDRYTDNIKKFYEIRENCGYNCEICIKTTGDFLTEEEKTLFYNTFGDYADRIFIENMAPCWPEFNVEKYSGINISKTKGIYNQDLNKEVNVCPYIFYSTTINSDGTVSLCFLDWKHNLIIGDIKKQSLKEIWNSKLLHTYQMNNINGKRKENKVCSKCGQLKYCLPDNIDPYVNRLKNKLIINYEN